MPRDINDIYTLPAGNPVIPGTVIETDWANSTLNDIAQALTDSLDKSDPTQARSTLGLGTAATKDSQVSPTDPLANRLLVVGAFGLGNLSSTVTIPDLNSTGTPTGLYTYQNAVSVGSKPTGSAANGQVMVDRFGASVLRQIWTDVVSGSVLRPRTWVRTSYTTNTWGDWAEVALYGNDAKFNTVEATGTIVSAGITNASEAAAGKVGEVITATRTTAIGQSNSVIRTVTQITLTPGDWEVDGHVAFGGTSPDTTVKMSCVSLAAATIEGDYATVIIGPATNTSIVNHALPTPTRRINVTENTTVYLTSNAVFSSGTQNVVGRIQARRVR